MSTKQIKLQSIITLNENSIEFAKVQKDFKISAILGIKLGVLNREIAPIIEEFNKSRNEAIEKHGEIVNEDGKEFKRVKTDNLHEFFNTIKSLTDGEFTINNLIDIKYFEGVDLPLFFSDALVDFIKE